MIFAVTQDRVYSPFFENLMIYPSFDLHSIELVKSTQSNVVIPQDHVLRPRQSITIPQSTEHD